MWVFEPATATHSRSGTDHPYQTEDKTVKRQKTARATTIDMTCRLLLVAIVSMQSLQSAVNGKDSQSLDAVAGRSMRLLELRWSNVQEPYRESTSLTLPTRPLFTSFIIHFIVVFLHSFGIRSLGPKGTQVRVTIYGNYGISDGFEVNGCTKGGIAIGEDKPLKQGRNTMYFTFLLVAYISGILPDSTEKTKNGVADKTHVINVTKTNDTIVGEDSFDNRLQHQEQRRNSSALWLQGVNFYFNSRLTKDRIYVVETEHGCSSTVGRRGGTQFITIDRNCAHLGGFAHEIGHALGFEHTHRRHDRDDYIAINWTNVGKQFEDRYPDLARSSFKNNYIKTYQKQFEKLPATGSVDYGFPYDYGSIMH
ncbi:astacin [Necator americanus]|uniref:Metalloendopeptidase n=1 Tax=Necator americanus TaxID=51031 RepID=W2SJB3_NECAM|nr:astacin [Necator americanus]ETN69690.1 astacin [Necator americanus]